MRENRIRTIWKAGGAVVNGWLAIPNAFSAETMAHQGWDSLTIDLQHGVVDYQAAVNMLTAISTTNTVPVVRVPWLEPGILMKTLDAGAYADRSVRWSTPARMPNCWSRPRTTSRAARAASGRCERCSMAGRTIRSMPTTRLSFSR